MKKLSLLVIVFTFLLISAESVLASRFSLEINPENTAGTGTPFPIDVSLIATSSVNAITFTISMSGAEIVDFSDGNSVVPIWVERLHKIGDGQWSASGIIPGGFLGDGKVLRLYLKGDSPGSVKIAAGGEFYQNDGSGTKEIEVPFVWTMMLVEGKINPPIDYSQDMESPETFVPVLGKVPGEQGEVWAVTFSTQDKGSGIDYYEVAESPSTSKEDAYTDVQWVRTESPYILKDQSLGSWVYVKAVDKKGLSTIQSLAPSGSWLKGSGQYILIALALIACLYVLFKLFSRRRT